MLAVARERLAEQEVEHQTISLPRVEAPAARRKALA